MTATGRGYDRWARWIAVACAAGLLLGMALQLLSAGAAVFVDAGWWPIHAESIHWFDWLAPLALLLGFAGGLSARYRLLCAAVLALDLVQYLTAGLRESGSWPQAAAIHPLTGFLLFWAITELLRTAWAERGARG